MKTHLPKSFEELIQTHPIPILVDFWAEWCAPCHILNPVIKELAQEWKGRVMIIKINIDEKPHIAQKYQIHSIPTLVLFKNGNPVHRITGALPKEVLKKELESFL